MPTIIAAASDGTLRGYGTWASIQSNGGTLYAFVGTYGEVGVSQSWQPSSCSSLSTYYLFRHFLAFDTSGVTTPPSSATISFYGWGYDTAPGYGAILVKSSQPNLVTEISATSANWLAADRTTPYSANKTSWSLGAWNTFTLNAAALSDISSLSTFKICFMQYDYDYLNDGPYNCPPTHANGTIEQLGFRSPEYGNSQEPKLDYVAGPTGPTITSITPNSGPVAGGTSVAIVGTNFVATPSVTINAVAATGETFNSSTSVDATTPAVAAGTYNVVITNPDAQSDTLVGGYTYNAVPTVSSITPTSGVAIGGTSVVLAGTGFLAGAAVTIDGNPATSVVIDSAIQITCNTPAGTVGAKNVVVTNTDSQLGTLVSGYTYTATPAPTVSSITPTSGFTGGGTSVVIAGTNFFAGAAVTVGGSSATSVVVDSAIQITCNTPAGTVGAKDVVVTNTDAQLGTLVGGYTYNVGFGGNKAAITSIYGEFKAGPLTNTLTTTLLENAASSGYAYKINSIIVTNIDGATAADLTMDIEDIAGSNESYITNTVSVLPDSTLIVIDREASFYLKENYRIRGGASANGDLTYIISYEKIG